MAKPLTDKPLALFSDSVRDLTRRVSPAVVQIEVTNYGSSDDNDRDSDQLSLQRTSGSGIVVDTAGYIMTNAHVIEHATALKVMIGAVTDGTRAGAIDSAPAPSFEGRIVGIDKDTDLALLKIDAAGLQAIEFGDSDAIAQGDVVLAIGSPMLLRNSLSMGVVSAPARSIKEDDQIIYIQTDASLNPGESGGALIDTRGRLIGMVTSILSKSGGDEGLGFAIPSDLVRTAYEQLRAHGTFSRASLGIVVQDITPTLARALSLHIQHGVMVTDFDTSSSPSSSSAGLQRQDVILSLDGTPVASARQLREMVYRRHSGEKVKLTIQRGEETFITTSAVDVRVPHTDPLALTGNLQKNLVSRLGIFCIEITKEVADLLPELKTQYGLLVVARTTQSQSEFIDLKQGDVIHQLNELPIASLDVFRERVDELHPGDAVALQIERHGHVRYTAFEIQ